MPSLPHWSTESGRYPPPNDVVGATFRWRPSRGLVVGLVLLGLLAALSLGASDLDIVFAGPVAAAAATYGSLLAWREAKRPARTLVIDGDGQPMIDGVPVDGLRIAWRGALAFARWSSPTGAVERLVWWPDTLPADRRREVRMAMPVETSPRVAR